MAEHALTSNSVAMLRTNEDALEIVVREHARLVFRIAYSALRNHHDAEDAVQETFMRAVRYRNKLSQVENPRLWIARIAWRVAVERSRRRANVPLSDKKTEYALSNLQSQHASAEDLMLQKENSQLLAMLIAALPEELKHSMVLSTVHDLTAREVAEVLGTSEASVRSRVFRARQLMKDKLAGLEGRYGIRKSK